MLEVILTPQTFWVALKDIGGMLSLMFFSPFLQLVDTLN
jgi:hypothetical protein